LNEKLGLRIEPTEFKGDIHLSAEEKGWASQIHELAGRDLPFWIIAAGGKYDLTIKWWATERYQRVVEHFRGRLVFAQVGGLGHHHPKLKNTIDLRGQTTVRELIRLVYHSQGVLCGITSLMHLAAAVETKHKQAGPRPCVVIAGGREPVPILADVLQLDMRGLSTLETHRLRIGSAFAASPRLKKVWRLPDVPYLAVVCKVNWP
jgi:hypothetical protein